MRSKAYVLGAHILSFVNSEKMLRDLFLTFVNNTKPLRNEDFVCKYRKMFFGLAVYRCGEKILGCTLLCFSIARKQNKKRLSQIFI